MHPARSQSVIPARLARLGRLCVTAAATLVLPSALVAQAHRVTGAVTAQGSSEPVAGATVQILGTTLATTTDNTGRFTLMVPSGTSQLRIRRLGFQARVVAAGPDDNTLSVSLTRDVLQLETQVVTGQATTVARINAANAVTVITAEEVNRVPQQTLEGALQGKVPGAVITQNSGAPGGGIQVQIRGVNTVNGQYQPLYVMDGVILDNEAYGNGLNAITGAGAAMSGQQGASITSNQDQRVNRIADINPQDIESIEILKGPSAGAIYGSRGANGVVIITTKRGSTGAAAFNVVQRFGTQALSKTMEMRCFTADQATTYVTAHLPAGYSSAAAYFAENPYAGCLDPQNQLYGNHGLSYETDASLRGGNSATTYYAAGSVRRDAGLASYDGYDKQSLRLNLSQVLGPHLSLAANTNIVHTLTQRGISGNDNYGISPIANFSSTPTFFDYSRRNATGAYVSNPWISSNANILQDASEIKTPENVYRQIGSASAAWNVLSWERQSLDFNLVGGIDHYSDALRVYSPPDSWVEQSGQISSYPGTITNGTVNSVNANLNLSGAHKFTTQAWTATTSGGLRQERAESDYITNLGNGLFPGVTNFASAVQTASSEGQTLTKTLSYYAQEELLLLHETLLLTAAVNSERSSTNGNADKFYSYPKLSVSYRLPWLPPATDNFKVRLATGQAGNRVLPDYKYTFLATLPEGGINGLRASDQIGLSTIFPEHTTEIEGGFDATFLGGRAGLEYSRYQKKTTDLILTANLAPSTGFSRAVINGGSMINVGTEIGFNVVPLQGGPIGWTANVTYSRNRGEILSLPVPAFATGSSFGERFGSSKIEVGQSPTQVVAFQGFDSTFVNGTYVSRVRHEAHFGDQAPDFQMGFTNEFSAGRFRLSSLVDWRKGGYAVNLTRNYFDQSSVKGGNFADTAGVAARLVRYSVFGDPVYLEHASFAKLRELRLSVELPPVLSSALLGGRATGSRLEVSGRNLATWTPYTGYDPEVSNFGNAAIGRFIDTTPYPPSRQFFFSLNTTF